MKPVIEIANLNKIYKGGFQALKDVSLEVKQGEIFALLGPNGAGKTTLISTICGTANATSGTIAINGHDNVKEYRKTRELVGLVPQELTTDAFETVWNTVSFSRGLFGHPPNPGFIEKILKDLSLWDKKDNKLMTLSGGMKRRVMIAKALSHEPRILFLDEPTAGVDVELRKDMWNQVRDLRKSGVTIILTTHYIEEAEEMADRIGVINKGQIILVEETSTLITKLGQKKMTILLTNPLSKVPGSLAKFDLNVAGDELTYTYDSVKNTHAISELFEKLKDANIEYHDIVTRESSLEEIFVELVKSS